MEQNQSNNQLVVPVVSKVLDQLKYEVAQELGIQIPKDGYYGYMTTRNTGTIGGQITRRLVQIAEQNLSEPTSGSSTTGSSSMSFMDMGHEAPLERGEALGSGENEQADPPVPNVPSSR